MSASFSRDLGKAISLHGRFQFIHFGLTGKGVVSHAGNPEQEGKWLSKASGLLQLGAVGVLTPMRGDETGGALTDAIALWCIKHVDPKTIAKADGYIDELFSDEKWEKYKAEQIAELAEVLFGVSDMHLRAVASRPDATVPDEDDWRRFAERFELNDSILPRENTPAERIRLSFLAAAAQARFMAFQDVPGGEVLLHATLGCL